MDQSPLHGKRIIILQQRAWGINIGHGVAKHLAQEGARLFAFTLKKTTHDFTCSQKEVAYEHILNHDVIMENPTSVPGSADITLAEICATLNIDSVWPYVGALRNHVRSYREKFYYSHKQNLSDEEIIEYIKALFKTIANIFETFKPELVVAANFVSLPHIFFNLYARSKNIPMFGATDSKVSGYNIFTYGFYDDRGPFYDRVDELNAEKTDSENRDRAREYITKFRTNFTRPEALERYLASQKSLKQRIKFHLAPWYHIVQWYYKRPTDYLANIGPTIDYRPPRIILRDYWQFKKNRKVAEESTYTPLASIKKYCYFPLQYQPESAIDVMAPFFNNQVEVARLVAQSMPDDYTLVVKEHPAMVGYRSGHTYEKLARTVNIKLVDYRISGEQVLSRAALVISPSSTTVAEASLLGKPSIQLGNLGTTLKMPGITKHTDLSTLAPKIKEILSRPINSTEHDRRLENFIAAAYDSGFNINYQKHWAAKQENTDAVWQTYRREIYSALGLK